MTKVSLRVYNHEIEGMIEASRLDEAIAHCQHILKTFPMYVETYRLLGKTFLEARKYADAADIFQRALMAVPDDFVSHVGMSIIRDDEGKLDDAIWHMERAFEVQPSNSAIQGELRRLYGRRDGVEPPKIRLSRDALANMYSQGELFNQAIAEIRSVLADDPNRPDLQAMLARANYRAGQKVEAAEMAAGLLKKYPYCMDALRVLVDVLPETARSENTQIYRHRLGMLDPYTIYATDSVFASDQVADSAVTLERLEYKPGVTPASTQPDWASSLGIQLTGEKRAEPTPEWQDSGGATVETTQPALEPSAPQPTEADDSLPEWMRTAGWQQSSGSNQEIPEEPSQEPASGPIAQADIPDWLKPMAPAEVTEAENIPAEASAAPPANSEDDIPDWLKSMAPTAAGVENITTEPAPAETSPTNAGIEPAEEGVMPDWLQSMAPTAAGTENIEGKAAPDETPPTNIEPEPAGEGALPDWIQSMAPTETDAENLETKAAAAEPPLMNADIEQAEEGAIPDWLQSLAPTVPAEGNIDNTAVSGEAPPTNIEPEPAQERAIPDWIQSMAPAAEDTENVEGVPAPAETPPTNIEPEPAQEAAIPDWLQSMAPAAEGMENIEVEPAPAETPPTNIEPEQAQEWAIPDWLQSMASEEAGPEKISTAPVPVENPPANPESERDFPDWLKSIAPADEVTPENTDTQPASIANPPANIEPEPAEEGPFPDWLKSITPTASTEVESAETTPSHIGSVPTNVEPEPEDVELPDTQPTPVIKYPVEIESEPEAVEEGQVPEWLPSPIENADTEDAAGFDAHISEAFQSEEPPTAIQPAAIETAPTSADQPVQTLPVPQMPADQEPVASTSRANVSDSEAFQPMGEAKPLDIGDDALGWLESLAAKQGANPDELLTKPQDRSVEMPDWLQQPIEEPKPALQVQELEIKPPEIMPSEPLSTPMERPVLPPVPAANEVKPEAVEEPLPAQMLNEEVAQPVNIEDDTMAWLERLAANQGAKPEEMLTKPEDRSETTPEWIRKASTGQLVPPEEIPMAPVPEAIESALIPTEEIPVEIASKAIDSITVPSEEDITITSWLNTLEKPEAATDIPATPPVQEEFGTSQEDLPDWLKDLEKPLISEPIKAEAPQNDIPDWLRQPAEPVSQEQTLQSSVVEPVSEPTPEPDMPAWMSEPEETTEPAVPTGPDEWIPVDKAAVGVNIETTPEKPPVTEPVLPPVVTPIQPGVIKGTGMLAHIPLLNKDADSLTAAQTALDNNLLNEAMKEYGKLIKKGHLLDEVIHDLREAIYRFPVDEIVWQTLGDAYMRANRLQDALDAYSKAEELLR